ncbi:MAG: MBL fold metallo-hydrolase [Clostridiaceae bacterium]|nr:MBL fold metallo-hydrolase [Clostridiaceae bacterium]
MMKCEKITKELSCFPERFRRCNVYLLALADQSIVFDPSLAPDMVPDVAAVKTIYATHAHYDHISAVNAWKEEMPARPFIMHTGDIPMLEDTLANASVFFGRPETFCHPDRALQGGEELTLNDDFRMDVIHTPGHTMGSSCFLIKKQDGNRMAPLALLTGDTLFDCGWGRTDFVTGDDRLMRLSLESLYRLLKDLPAGLPVCPGHGGITTASQACRFLQASGFSS